MKDAAQDASANMQEDWNFSLCCSSVPHLISQAELIDPACELDLPKAKTQLLWSWLQQWNLLLKNVNVFFYRKRKVDILNCSSIEGDLVPCDNTEGLMEELHVEYKHERLRFFLDSSKISLKTTLLHNGNMQPSIPLLMQV